MAETAFDRTERGLGSADLSIPDIVARTKGNPQDIMKLVMNGQINVTQGLLAKRLSDSVVAERNAMAAQQSNVLQEQFPELAQATGGLGAAMPPQMGAPMPPQGMPPQGMPPQGMPPAQGGIGGLDFAPAQMAGGGIVGYPAGGAVAAPGQPDDPFALQEVSLEEMLAGVRQNIPRKTDAMQRYREALEGSFDPEKAKKQAELSGIFAGLGSIKPGMSPMEALVSGFVGSGQQIQQAKKESKKEEMAMLKSVAELEGLENEMTRKDYELAYQLKQYKEGRYDKQRELRFQDKWNKEDNDTKILATRLTTGAQIRAAEISAAASRDSSRDYKTSQAFAMLTNVRKQAEDAVDGRLGSVQAQQMKMQTPTAYRALVAREENSMINAIAGDDAALARQLRTIQGGTNASGDGSGGAIPPWRRNYAPTTR
jgi:hypothetical protein